MLPRPDAVRRFLTIGLVLSAALVGLVAAPPAPAGAQNAAATGTVVEDMITVQGIVALDDSRAGSWDYLIDVTASLAVPDGYRVAGPDEMAFYAVDSVTDGTIGVATTDANGIAVIDGEVGATFYLFAQTDADLPPFGTEDLFIPASDSAPALSVTAVQYVANPTPAPSVAPSVDASVAPPSPGPSGGGVGILLPDAITIQGLVVEDAARAGETEYLLGVTAAATGDFRAAAAGEQTYESRDLSTDAVIDRATTDADGVAVLDGQVDAPYYVVETSDTGAIPGTASFLYGQGDPNAYQRFAVIVYVAGIVPSVSASASTAASASASTTPSLIPSSSPSVTPSASSSASASDTLGASPTPAGSSPASAVPSPAASGEPPSGVRVTITTAVPLPDGAEVCLDATCQTLDAAPLSRQAAAVPFARTVSTGRDLIAQAVIPAGTVIVFEDVPPGDYTLTVSFAGELLYTEAVTVVAGQPVSVVIDERDRVDPPAAVDGDGLAGMGLDASSVPTSRPVAPVVTDRSGVGSLPDTGTGLSGGAPGGGAWSLVALGLALVAVVMAGLVLGRGRRAPAD